MNTPKRAGSTGTRQEMERLLNDIRERVLVSPAKAAKILANWLEKGPGAQKKTNQTTQKKRVA